jgi:cholesterol transport system auxiliary component
MKLFACLGTALALAGCTSSLLDSELPVSVGYVLAPAPLTQIDAPATQADLSIGRPDLAPGLDTQRIAVLRGRQLDYFRSARWGGTATEVVQTMLVDSLEDQRLFRSVTAEQARVAGDYVLDVEVRDFQAEYAGADDAPTVNVMMVGRLIRVVDRKLLGSIAAQAQSRAADNRMNAVAAAFESAAQKVALDLAQKAAIAVAGDEQTLKEARSDQEVK